MNKQKKNRTLEIFFRGMSGEDLSPRVLAAEYEVSAKTITRDLNDIKDFLAESRDLVGYAELEYSYASKSYRLNFNEFLTDRELFAIAKVILGSRAFSAQSMSSLMSKLKRFASVGDRQGLDEILRKELYHYSQPKHDCENVTDNLWQLIGMIADKKEITISYYKVDRSLSEKRIQPVSIMFSEYYFYLIAYYPNEYNEPRYFRIDRITNIIKHRKSFATDKVPNFDEGELRNRSQFMFYGKLRKIRFWYTGPSLQAILDKLPTAKIIERNRNNYLLEAEVYGDGIKMFLLSQGTWVKVVAPEEFVREMGDTIREMSNIYNE